MAERPPLMPLTRVSDRVLSPGRSAGAYASYAGGQLSHSADAPTRALDRPSWVAARSPRMTCTWNVNVAAVASPSETAWRTRADADARAAHGLLPQTTPSM